METLSYLGLQNYNNGISVAMQFMCLMPWRESHWWGVRVYLYTPLWIYRNISKNRIFDTPSHPEYLLIRYKYYMLGIQYYIRFVFKS